VEKILGLAKGLKESPTVVFEACAGELYPGLNDASVAQLLSDYSELGAKGKTADVEFAMRLLREKVDQALEEKSHRNA
jgi:hypothetical protein